MRFSADRRGGASAAMAASLALLFAAAPLCAQISISVHGSSGIAMGIAREIVYDTGTHAGYTLSLLDWQMEPLLMARTDLEARTGFGLVIAVSVASGFPAWSGAMEDRDYLNYDGVITHFSRHDCYTEHALLLDLRAGWHFPVDPLFALEPFVSLSAMRLRWSARDGYLQYPPQTAGPFTPWDATDAPTRIFGTCVLYAQDVFYPSLGLVFSLTSPDSPEVKLSLAVSPYVLLSDTDNHLLRQVDFHESFGGGLAVEPGLAMVWRLSDRTLLDLDLSYRHVGCLVGSSYEVGTGIQGQDPGAGTRSVLFRDGAGASIDLLRASVGLSLSY